MGECEQKFEVFVKMQKKFRGGLCRGVGFWGVQIDKWGGGGRVGEGGQGGCERRIKVFVKI